MDELERSLLNVFTNSDLNRMVGQRKDQAKLDSLQSDSSSRYCLFFEDRFLMHDAANPGPVFVDANEVGAIQCSTRNVVFLGSRDAKHFFALELLSHSPAEKLLSETVTFAGLRESGHSLTAQDATMLSYAKAMFHWHRAHEFCGTCGTKTQSIEGGHSRRCMNAKCNKTHFPRTDPAIIVAVTKDDRCLFGRQKSWPNYRFSVIAGFVEPGESVEQAVVREVHEETNINLNTVHYHSSQPWPFPGSIMLGFSATASNFDIQLNDGELQEAHWRNVDEIVGGLESGTFRLPPKLSIAYRLIEDWFDASSIDSLAKTIENLSIVRSW